MAKTPEGKVKDAVKKVLQEFGAWYFMPIQNGMGVVGIPDFIGCYKGQFFAIETKAPGKLNTLTPNQLSRISEINRADGITIVTDSAETVRNMFNAMQVYARMTKEAKTHSERRDEKLQSSLKMFHAKEEIMSLGIRQFESYDPEHPYSK